MCIPFAAPYRGTFLCLSAPKPVGLDGGSAIPALANIAAQAFRGAAALGLVVAAMGYGRRYLNRESRALSVARDLAFPLYVLHFAPLSAATYLLLGTGLGVWARWALAVGASWVTVAILTCLARFIPVVRGVLGIRPGRLLVTGVPKG